MGKGIHSMCEHDADFEAITRKVDTILECLNGNGKPGLKTQMEVTKVRMRGVYFVLTIHLASLIGVVYAVFRA